MLGLFAMIFVLLMVTSLIGYWISWDLQPVGTRSSFAAKVAGDLAKLSVKCLGYLRSSRSNLSAMAVRTEHDTRLKTVAATSQSGAVAANRS